MQFKQSLFRLVGESNVGRWEYLARPRLRHVRGGPFNGQQIRRGIFQDLVKAFDFDAIIETGTFRGITTKYFAETGIPVYTVEANARYLAFARMNLKQTDASVFTYHSDSRSFLKELGDNGKIAGQQPFIYLDAHWHDDLPLRDELEIVQRFWPQAVIMVDDFAVPGTDYEFDDYGDGKALTLDYLASLTPTRLQAYFPSVGPDEETGCRRGCVVLADPDEADLMATVRSLRYHGGIGQVAIA